MAISKALKTRFEKACAELNAVLREARKTEPEANYYLQEDTLHLMKGESHDKQEKPVHSNSVADVHIPHSGGGAW